METPGLKTPEMPTFKSVSPVRAGLQQPFVSNSPPINVSKAVSSISANLEEQPIGGSSNGLEKII